MATDFFLKFDDFHKFESFEDAAEGAAHDLRRLGRNSVDLGDGFLRLIHDGTPAPTETGSLVSVDLKFKHDDAIISHDFLKVGLDFLEASASQHKLNVKEIVIIKVVDKSSPILFSEVGGGGGGGASTVETDLLNYEADLKITGLDFLKIAAGGTDAPAEALSLNFSKVSTDYKMQSADELKLSQDFVALANSAEELKLHKLADAFLKYSEDALKLSANDLKVSQDYLKISQDFVLVTSTDAAATGDFKFNQVVLQNSTDFINLAGDLKFVNADLKLIGGDTLKLADALEDAAHKLLPAVQKG